MECFHLGGDCSTKLPWEWFPIISGRSSPPLLSMSYPWCLTALWVNRSVSDSWTLFSQGDKSSAAWFIAGWVKKRETKGFMCEKQRKPEQKRSPGSSGLYHGACGYAGDHIGSQCTRKLWETNKDRVTDEPAVLPSCGPRITLTWKGQTNMERSSLLFFFFLTMMRIRFLRIPLILRFPLAISLLNCSETHMAV